MRPSDAPKARRRKPNLTSPDCKRFVENVRQQRLKGRRKRMVSVLCHRIDKSDGIAEVAKQAAAKKEKAAGRKGQI
jgi:hypothetical protein